MSSIVNISWATEADMPALAYISTAARQSDLMSRLIFGRWSNANTIQSEIAAALRKELLNPKVYIYKATTKDTNEIVGFCHVYLDDGKTEEPPKSLFSITEGLWPLLTSSTQKKHKDLFAGQPHWVGKQLMVLPKYQRRGIGRALINWGLANIEHEAIPIYTDASVSGRRLYESVGFQVAEVVTVGDATPESCGTEGYSSACMIGQLPGNQTKCKL